jgi:putative ABC transport system permease protein
MISTLTRKSFRELRRHRFRSALAVITVAATVMGLWLLAVPRGFDAAMGERAESDRLHHLRLSPSNFYLTDPEHKPEEGTTIDAAVIAAVGELDNVAAVETRPAMYTQMRADGETQDVWLVGVENFSAQQVNVVRLEDGRFPDPYRGDELETIADTASAAAGRYVSTTGDEIAVMAGDGEFYPFTVTGSGGTLAWSAAMDGPAVLFVPADTVNLFLGAAGFNSLEIRLADASPDAAASTLQEVKRVLSNAAPAMGFNRIAELRDEGSWPGRENVTNLLPLLYIVVAIAVIAAVMLVGTTMNTIVRGQTSEIGILRALGASRHTIVRSYVGTALILGGLGTVVGTGAGIVVGNTMASAIQEELLGFDPGWRIDGLVAAAGVFVGILGSVLAAVPAARKAIRLSVQDALNGHPSTAASGSTVDWLVHKARWLPPLAAIGLRNVVRLKSRSAAAGFQVALGASVALALGSFAVTGITVTNDTMSHEGSDIQVYARHGTLALDVEGVLAGVDGVAAAQPIIYANITVAGRDVAARGLPAVPVYEPNLISGRWFSSDEVRDEAAVTVLGEPLAAAAGVGVGDLVDIGLKDSVTVARVVGVDATLVNDGKFALMPITTLMTLTTYQGPTAYWVETVSHEHEDVDQAVDAIAAALNRTGHVAEVIARYPEIEQAQAEDRIVVGVIQAMGLPILGIGMIGLVGAMASNIVERRREIGVLRAIGARKRHLRRIFQSEGLAVVAAGWAMALPIGYALSWLIVREFSSALEVHIDVLFPLWLPAIVLGGVIVVGSTSMRLPMRSVVKMRPSDAIRYE